jgi:hypothetical protein
MRVEEHPFHVLGITARSGKREILERAEVLSIQSDPERISACRLQVTHPVKRLDAEVSWFPGLAPSKIRRIIDVVGQDSKLLLGLETRLFGVDCLWGFNALAYGLAAHSHVSSAAWETVVPRLVENLQNIDADELMATLNADRSAAGMAQITDITTVKDALKRHSENTAEFLPALLIRCPRHAHVAALVVGRDTDGGESQVSDFIGCLVDRYQILVQPILGRQGDRLTASCEEALSIARQQPLASARMTASVIELGQILSEWGVIARPNQLLMRSRGLKDSQSLEVGKRVRSIAVKLANEFDLHEEAQQITRNLYDVFDSVPDLAELLGQDFETLDGIINTKDVGVSKEDERQAELNFDEDAGCPKCGRSMVLQKSPSDSSYACNGPDCPEAQSANSATASAPNALQTLASDWATSADSFAQLCQSIRLKCRQSIRANDSHRHENLAMFNAAYRDYCRQVSPWLAIICATHCGGAHLVMNARTAAAECLSFLAGGLIIANDFDAARKLCLEALPLVFDNEALQAEIKSRLDHIASTRQKVANPPPSPAGRTAAAPGPGKASASASPTPRPQPLGRPFFDNAGNARARLPLAAAGIALLVGIPFLIHILIAPQWEPNVLGARPTGEVKAATTVPQLPPHESLSLANGTNLIRPQNSKGLGTLKISNYTNHDAAVKLKTWAGRTARFVYVRAMSDFTVAKISPGEYMLQFTTGRDWNANELAFREERAFATFDQMLSFTYDGASYSTYEITLHAVANGNVRETGISAEEFSDDQGTGADTKKKR